jgi:uncharacterized protein GlcG (DUF336 family)
MPLTFAVGQRVVEAAHAKASSLGLAITVAVVDRRGDIVALGRMDGAAHFAAEVALGKAIVSGVFGKASGDLGDASAVPVYQAISALHLNRMIFLQGGVPLTTSDEVVGGVGVSGGGTPGNDEVVALAGAAALS